MVILKEETDNVFLNPGLVLYGSKCSKCKQIVVKPKTLNYDKEIYNYNSLHYKYKELCKEHINLDKVYERVKEDYMKL